MTFEQLEYFIAVTEHDTFLDAAETLHITQSALSKQIMKLERELGITLLDRSHRSASLTEAGRIFYQDALKLTRQYHQVLAHLEQYKNAAQKEIHVGTLPILNQYHLTPLFKKFSEQHPDIHVFIDEVEEEELISGLDSDRYECIIARKNMVNSRHYTTYPLTEDELTAVFPCGHALACRTSVSLQELADESFILMNRYTSIYQLCMESFQCCGISPDIIRTARVESILSAVAIGEGISLLAKSNFQVFHHENVTVVPLNPPIRLPVVIAKKSGRADSPAVRALIRDFTG